MEKASIFAQVVEAAAFEEEGSMPEKDPEKPKPSKKPDEVSVPEPDPDPEPMPETGWDEAGLPGDPTTDGPPPRPKKEDEP